MDYDTHRFSVLAWLIENGGRGRIISGALELRWASGSKVEVSALVSPRNHFCPEFPLMAEIFDDSDFRVYDDAEGEWLCPATHPKGYQALLAEAVTRVGSAPAAT